MDKNKLYRYFEGTASDEEMQEIRTWSEQNEDNEALLRRERKALRCNHSLRSLRGIGGQIPGAQGAAPLVARRRCPSICRRARDAYKIYGVGDRAAFGPAKSSGTQGPACQPDSARQFGGMAQLWLHS